MASIQALSDEVLIIILETLALEPGLSRHNSKRALYSLSICSRRFHRITQEILYRSISVHKIKDILCLARTALYRHDLAEYVQRLHVSVQPDNKLRDIRCLEKDVEDYFETVLRQLCQSSESTQYCPKDLRSNQGGASVALLLMLLPNLTDLDMWLMCPPKYVITVMQWSTIQHRQSAHTFLPQQIQNTIYHHHPVLSRLSVVRLEAEHSMNIQFLPIMLLPSLRTFFASSLYSINERWSTDAGVSSIHHLELVRCGVDGDDITALLRPCKELRSFTYYWDEPWSDEDVFDDLDDGLNIGPRIIEGIQQNKDTLEVLSLVGEQPIRHDTMSLGSLTAFSRLHSLCAPAVMAIKPDDSSPPRLTLDLLPRSLKNLNLSITGGAGDEMLESELLRWLRLEKGLPALAALTITWQGHDQDPPSGSSFNCVERMCRDRGVAFAFETIQSTR